MMGQLKKSDPRYPGPVVCWSCGKRCEESGWIELYEKTADGSYSGVEYVCADCDAR